MREQFRVLLLGTAVFQGSLISPSVVFGQDDTGHSDFVPRSDRNAAEDLKSLRYALSRLSDSAGAIDPLADYAKIPDGLKKSPEQKPAPIPPSPSSTSPGAPRPTQPRSDSSPENDVPKNGVPKSPAGSNAAGAGPARAESSGVDASAANRNRIRPAPHVVVPASGRERLQRVMVPIENGDPCVPRIVWDSCVKLDMPKQREDALAANDSRQPSSKLNVDASDERETLDPEAQQIPQLSADGRSIIYASAHLSVPVVTAQTTLDYSANFQEIPFGSQGTPIIPLPTSPSLPSVYPPAGNVMPTTPQVYPQAQVYPPIEGYPVNPSVAPANPIFPPVNQLPITQLPQQAYPITQVPVQTLPTYPSAPVFVAPAPYYVQPQTPIANVPVQTPITSPVPLQPSNVSPLASNTQLPTYSLEGESVVNYKPFVSGPPRQVDSRRMVSPTLFRPANSSGSCNPCGTGAPGYAAPVGAVPGAGPLTYAPPTYMPYPTNNNAGYRPLIGFGQDIRQAQLGRGIIGQPTAYMPSQPVRNFFRYIFP